jgi:hypothetical protein
LSSLRTDRFLDPPELEALHDTGNQVSFFDRFDFRPGTTDTIHLNVQAAHSGFDVPNTYDQVAQTQHQNIATFNVAPGYSRVIGANTLFTANGFVRRDHLTYLPSANPLDDTPATVSQDRMLTNMGAKADLTMILGAHSLKFGGTIGATRLQEQFTFGITDPTDGAFAGEDGNFDPALAPFDLTNGGSPLAYDQSFTIKQQAAYVQDDIKAGNATLNLGVRLDHYDGLTTATLVQPRVGVSYAVTAERNGAACLLRADDGNALQREPAALRPGMASTASSVRASPYRRAGATRSSWGSSRDSADGSLRTSGYFNKRTDNGYDFGRPVQHTDSRSLSHGITRGSTDSPGRLNLVEHRGFSAFVVMAHTNAIYSPPGAGGILLEQPEGDFRIDHDQKFNATTNVQYVFEKRTGAWAALSWRYDSGLVAGAVASLEDALALTADQQAAIGFFCGSQFATRDVPLTKRDLHNVKLRFDAAEDSR